MEQQNHNSEFYDLGRTKKLILDHIGTIESSLHVLYGMIASIKADSDKPIYLGEQISEDSKIAQYKKRNQILEYAVRFALIEWFKEHQGAMSTSNEEINRSYDEIIAVAARMLDKREKEFAEYLLGCSRRDRGRPEQK